MATLLDESFLPKLPASSVVAATEFVRQFARFARQTSQGPVHIAQHGHVCWSLLTIESFEEMLSHADGSRVQAELDIVLETIKTIVILFDDRLNILLANKSACQHFRTGGRELRGTNFSALIVNPTQTFILDACSRVLQSGMLETFEVDSSLYPGRTLRLQMMPFQTGIALFADDITQFASARQAGAANAALAAAIGANAWIGSGRVNLSGAIVDQNATLASFAQSSPDRITGMRLPSLFEQRSRDAVRDAVDTLLTTGAPFSMAASLLTGSGSSAPVTLSAAAEREQGAISGMSFIVAQCA